MPVPRAERIDNMANQSQTELFIIDLQRFAEGDPVDPAPVDPTPTDPAPSDLAPTDPPESTDPNKPTEPVPNDPAPTPSPIKVKFNHEEKEIPFEEAITLIQKGMNYDKVHGNYSEVEAALKARDEEVARRFAEQGIKTWDDLVKGWDTTQQRQQSQMIDQQFKTAVEQEAVKYGADPDRLMEVINNLIGHHPKVKQANQLEQENGQIKTQQEIQARINREAVEFKAAYPKLDYATIPQEVWDRCNRGYSLMDSYQIHENKVLKETIAAQEKANKVKETNQNNATNSPGSVTGNGNVPSGHFTREQVQKMSQAEVTNNLDAITESMKSWK
jgi:hypothetical protein